MSHLILQAVDAHYANKKILQQIDLGPLAAGQLHVLLGANAAGKSTLLKRIYGELTGHGEIFWGAQSISKLKKEHPLFPRYVPQDTQMNSSMTVFEAILIPLKQSGAWQVSDADMRSIDQLMQQLAIAHLAARKIQHLSGGQRQLVAIAQALICQPKILLLDEPTSALDLHHQFELLRLLKQIAKAQQICILTILHDINLALNFADSLSVLHQGEIYASGTPQQVITPQMLADVYRVRAHLLHSHHQQAVVVVEAAL
ncbi:ABC transporter ATP-binding protein [Acinetobacter larvae]|uniref:ABC transporter domain-containing protein n=1 Tax=Acinetobacter larvae TaxID=1789224 RepID=A0A1B2M2W8_9GAMM|nr:ABC transporter ATP-binding protein [Acinetobacter larvae]AOA59373.1 hypothetical protein BFG52_14080 [Acinetobacter larvae]